MATRDSRDTRKTPVPEKLAEAKPHTPEGSPRHGQGGCRPCDGPVEVTINARPIEDTEQAEINTLIRYQTQLTSFVEYKRFMDSLTNVPPESTDSPPAATEDGTTASIEDAVLARMADRRGRLFSRHGTSGGGVFKIHGTIPYELLRLATELWLLTRCGPACSDFTEDPNHGTKRDAFLATDAGRWGIDKDDLKQRVLDYVKQYVTAGTGATPYLELIVNQLLPTLPTDPLGHAYRGRWECPSMIELIWSYWHEEGGQSQAMNAIALRFQNRRSRPGRDPLANLAIDPLRPAQNLLWGWVEASYKRLTVERRAYEYDHHYGLTLLGKAVPPLLSADSRSKFLEAFHSLLHIAHLYYVERADTTRIPDGFPLLNALRHVHLILAEGAHNQHGDLPWTSRVEMLIEQWFLARPELREFLRGRAMVPYHEAWMGQVDTMKKLQGWSDVTVTHFHELATTGEAALLSVRHGPWATTNDQEEAKTWADYWRPEIQRYIYAYKAATGADLTIEPVNTTMPARLLQARLARQQAAVAY